MLAGNMTRENKLALVVGFALILVVGILISDHFSTAQAQAFADLHAAADPLAEAHPPDAPLLDLDRGNSERPSADLAPFSAAQPETQVDNDPHGQTSLPMPPAEAAPIRLHMPDLQGQDLQPSPSPAEAPVAATAAFRFHDVRPGDSLTAICREHYGGDALVAALAQFNGLEDPDTVRVGRRLRIPPADTLPAPRNGAERRERPPPAAGEYGTYQVKPGDCLTEIAQRLLGSSKQWQTLYQLNREIIRDPDEIPVGAVIKFPRSHNPQ